MTDPLERLTNLVALLLETQVPLTFNEIVDELRGQYPEGLEARRAAFEREKKQLRAMGVPLTMVMQSGDRAGQPGYRIERDQFEIGDFGLSDDERTALQLAVATVRLGAAWGETALIKLGGAGAAEAGALSASLVAPSTVPTLFDAVARRCEARFVYHGRARAVEPWGLLARGGFWYLVGHEREAGDRRTFRVDRIEGGVTLGEEGAFERPQDFDVRTALPADIKELGDAEGATHAEVLIDADRARAALLELGAEALVERRADGAIVARVACVNRPAFRSWVLGFLDHAEVLAPPEVRHDVVAWLRGLVEDA